MTKQLKPLVYSFLLAFALSGCANSPLLPNTSISSSPPQNNSLPVLNGTLTLCTKSAGTGYYMEESLFPNSCNLFYLDYESQQKTFLCNVPNCAHTDESCTSYIALADHEMPPIVLSAGEHILLVKNGASETRPAGIQIANQNGQNRKDLLVLPASQSLGGVYTDGTFLYSDVYSVEEISGKPVRISFLVKIDMKTGQQETLMELPYDKVLVGAAHENFVLDSLEYDETGTGGTHAFYYLHQPAPNHSAALDPEPFYQYDMTQSGAYISDGTLYTFDYSNCVFSAVDLKTLEEKSVDCSSVISEFDPTRPPEVAHCYGGYFWLNTYPEDSTGNHPPVSRLINLDEKRISDPITLQISSVEKMPMPIDAYQSNFLIVYEYGNKTISYTGKNGLETLEVSWPLYAFINQEDYFASKPNYVPFREID